MPVKPNYRVLIDNRETQHGQLFFPDAPTSPGWGIPQEVGFSAGEIKYQVNDDHWRIGNWLTVSINENKALGMESHSMTVNLRQMALQFWYDIIVSNYKLTESDHNLNLYVEVRIDGQMGLINEFQLWVKKGIGPNTTLLDTVVKIKPGQRVYQFNKKVSFTDTVPDTALGGWVHEEKKVESNSVGLQILVRPGYNLKTGKVKYPWRDIDHTNDSRYRILLRGVEY